MVEILATMENCLIPCRLIAVRFDMICTRLRRSLMCPSEKVVKGHCFALCPYLHVAVRRIMQSSLIPRHDDNVCGIGAVGDALKLATDARAHLVWHQQEAPGIYKMPLWALQLLRSVMLSPS